MVFPNLYQISLPFMQQKPQQWAMVGLVIYALDEHIVFLTITSTHLLSCLTNSCIPINFRYTTWGNRPYWYNCIWLMCLLIFLPFVLPLRVPLISIASFTLIVPGVKDFLQIPMYFYGAKSFWLLWSLIQTLHSQTSLVAWKNFAVLAPFKNQFSFALCFHFKVFFLQYIFYIHFNVFYFI